MVKKFLNLKIFSFCFKLFMKVKRFVCQEKPEHLEMIDGTVAQLLHEKWETFARFRWKINFNAAFVVI